MMTQTSKQAGVSSDSANHQSCGQNGCCAGLAELLEPRLFKALGDPSRQALLACLSRCCRPCSVSEIATCCDIDFSVVSRHLALLEQAGVLSSHKVGRSMLYELRFGELAERLRALAEALEACEAQCKSPRAACTGVCCCAPANDSNV